MRKINLQMFASVFDLTSVLEEVPSTIVIGEKTFPIHDRFSDIIALDELMRRPAEPGKNADLLLIKDFLRIVFGEENATELLKMDLPLKTYKLIMENVKKVIAGEEVGDKSTGS